MLKFKSKYFILRKSENTVKIGNEFHKRHLIIFGIYERHFWAMKLRIMPTFQRIWWVCDQMYSFSILNFKDILRRKWQYLPICQNGAAANLAACLITVLKSNVIYNFLQKSDKKEPRKGDFVAFFPNGFFPPFGIENATILEMHTTILKSREETLATCCKRHLTRKLG